MAPAPGRALDGAPRRLPSSPTLLACLFALFTVLAGGAFAAPSATAAPIAPSVSVAEGAVLDLPPAEITLTFPATVDDKTFELTLVHDSGHGILMPAPTMNGSTVIQTMPRPMVRGVYRLEWSGRTSGGEPVTGGVNFTVKKGLTWPTNGPAPVPTTSFSARPVPVTPSAAGDPSTTTAPAGPTTPPTPASTQPAGVGGTATLWVGLIVAAVVAAVGAVVVLGLRGTRS